VWANLDKAFALGAHHWFLFAQPFDLPERLVGADPDFVLSWTLEPVVTTTKLSRVVNNALAWSESFCVSPIHREQRLKHLRI